MTVTAGLHLNPNVFWLVFSQSRAGHERGPDLWIRWTTTGCVTRLPLVAGTVSYLHMDAQDTDLAAPGRSGP